MERLFGALRAAVTCDICGRPVARDAPGFGLCNYCKARIQLHHEHMERGHRSKEFVTMTNLRDPELHSKLDELEKKYPILRFFHYDHLPGHLQEISIRFSALAYEMAERETTAFAEVAAGLRKLLEAKDCAVRAALP